MTKKIYSIYLLLFLVLSIAVPSQTVHAGVQPSPEQSPLLRWGEIRTDSFAIIYEGMYEQVAQGLYTLYGPMLDAEYIRFSALFNQELTPPISVRIYSDADEYYKLNALAPELGPEQTHSNIGAREISLIGDRIALNITMWQAEAENAFRFELAQLFVTELSNNQIPPGLKASIGGYAQDPATSVGQYAGSGLESMQITSSPEKLWENDNLYLDPIMGLQGLSTVAYLVEAYGWQSLIDFITLIPKSEDYQEAFKSTYDLDLSEFETLWQAYFPPYIKGRWQYNVLYNYDLAKYETLLNNGAYTDTGNELEEVMAVMDIMGNTDHKTDIQNLLDRAQEGSTASSLAYESRKAFLDGDMETCINKADQSEQIFAGINDTDSIETLNNYRERATRAAEIRQDVTNIQKSLLLGNPKALSRRLNADAYQLGELGDISGQEMVYETIEQLSRIQKPKQIILIIVILLISTAAIWYRIRLSRKEIPPEARL